MNATGIAPDGNYAISIETYWGVFSKTYRFWKYTQQDGWQTMSVGPSQTDYRKLPGDSPFVAGAISPKTGEYFYGYFIPATAENPNANFELYVLTSSNNERKVARISVPWPTTHTARVGGDIALDAEGNLFILAGEHQGTISRTYVVRRGMLEDRALAALPEHRREVSAIEIGQGTQSLSGATGGAFRTDGSMLIGTDSYSPPNIATVDALDFSPVGHQPEYHNGNGDSRYDLASCDRPLTLVIKQNIVGRKKATDQFTLKMERTQPATTLATQHLTTSGNMTGIQNESLGPLPIVVGHTYRMTETLNGQDNLIDNYAVTWTCTAASGLVAQGAGQEIRLTPKPEGGEQITCTITNTPTGSISWEGSSDTLSNSTLPSTKWTLAIRGPHAIPMTVSDCHVQQGCEGTNDQDPRPGYLHVANLHEGTYVLKQVDSAKYHSVDRTERVITIDHNKHEHNLGTIVNTAHYATVTLKVRTVIGAVEEPVPNVQDRWELGITLPGTPEADRISVNNGPNSVQTTAANGQLPHEWRVFFDNANDTTPVHLSHIGPRSYTTKRLECQYADAQDAPTNGRHIDRDTGSQGASDIAIENDTRAPRVNLPELRAGQKLTCTFVMAKTPPSLERQVVSVPNLNTRLGGSAWTLTAHGREPRSIQDCLRINHCDDTNDNDPRPGYFKVAEVLPGEYILEENYAPAGYVVSGDSTRRFTITAHSPTLKLGKISNSQRAPLSIPLTGGHAADRYMITGIVLMAASGVTAASALHRRRQNPSFNM